MENFRKKNTLKEAKRNATKIPFKPHCRIFNIPTNCTAGCTGSNKVDLPEQKTEQLRNVTKSLSLKTGNRKHEKSYIKSVVRLV